MISAEVCLAADNSFLDGRAQSYLPKSFDQVVMIAPETQKPEEPDSVPSEKLDDKNSSSIYTAYLSCKDAGSSNEHKYLQDKGAVKSSDQNSFQNHSMNMDLQSRKRESDEALLRPELKFGVTVPINEEPENENYIPNKSI